MYRIHIYHGLLKCFLGQSQRTNRIWFPWFEFDLPPFAQGGLHVHAGEEHGGWQWNWWRDPFAKRQLLTCWKPKMAWVCFKVAIETCQLKFADFEVKTAILSKVEMLGICMQLNNVSIHMKIWMPVPLDMRSLTIASTTRTAGGLRCSTVCQHFALDKLVQDSPPEEIQKPLKSTNLVEPLVFFFLRKPCLKSNEGWSCKLYKLALGIYSGSRVASSKDVRTNGIQVYHGQIHIWYYQKIALQGAVYQNGTTSMWTLSKRLYRAPPPTRVISSTFGAHI